MLFFFFLFFIFCSLLGVFPFFSSLLRPFGLFYFGFIFICVLFFLFFFNKGLFWYQVVLFLYTASHFNVSCVLGFDGISIFLVLLSVFLLTLCFLFFWHLRYKLRLYFFLLSFSLVLLINVFLSLDLFFFFFFFEAIVIPLFFLIGIWGSRLRKVYAAYQFFVYTLLGSVFIILSVLSIFFSLGSSSFEVFFYFLFFSQRQFIVWLFLFIGFSVKIPILPFHVWLPEAHVEAPTPGSVILAGLLLKFGTYAILRFLVNSFFSAYFDLLFFLAALSVFGLCFSSCVALNQIDVKKLIAYSSIAHMNFSLMGFFSQSFLGLSGAFFMMLGHAITSAALFFGIGILYDRYKTRLIFYYSGLVTYMPIFASMFFFFVLSNFGFPGTINFVGEFLIAVGFFQLSNFFATLSLVGLFLSLTYSLFLYNRIFFGRFFPGVRYYSDVTRLEFCVLFFFVFFIVAFGLAPNVVLSFAQQSLKKLIFFCINF